MYLLLVQKSLHSFIFRKRIQWQSEISDRHYLCHRHTFTNLTGYVNFVHNFCLLQITVQQKEHLWPMWQAWKYSKQDRTLQRLPCIAVLVSNLMFFMVALSLSSQMSGQYLTPNHNHFLSHLSNSLFTIHPIFISIPLPWYMSCSFSMFS